MIIYFFFFATNNTMENDIHCQGEAKKEFVSQKLVLDKAADKAVDGIMESSCDSCRGVSSKIMVSSGNST